MSQGRHAPSALCEPSHGFEDQTFRDRSVNPAVMPLLRTSFITIDMFQHAGILSMMSRVMKLNHKRQNAG